LTSAKTPHFKHQNYMLDKLILQSIQSGAITAIAAILELLLFLKFHDAYFHVTVLFFIGKLQAN
ncbi:hypothetical protein H0H92_008374, partial [Tricholoma furcatifolium]